MLLLRRADVTWAVQKYRNMVTRQKKKKKIFVYITKSVAMELVQFAVSVVASMTHVGRVAAQTTASTFNCLGQFASSPGNCRLCCRTHQKKRARIKAVWFVLAFKIALQYHIVHCLGTDVFRCPVCWSERCQLSVDFGFSLSRTKSL